MQTKPFLPSFSLRCRLIPACPRRRTFRVVLSAAILFALSSSLDATTFYVATTGNDSNPGTQSAPLGTIQRGVDLARPGDTITVADGTYGPNGHYTCGTQCSQNGYSAPVTFQTSGTATAAITITAQNKWGAILDCQLPYGYSGDGTDGVQACDTYFDFQGTASYITISGFDIQRDYWVGAMVNSNNSHITFIGNHFHDIGNRFYSVPAGTSSYGIVGVYAGTGSSYITWTGNEFNNIGRLPHPAIINDDYSHDHGLYIYNGPYTITNNIFYSQSAGWNVQTSPGSHDIAITNNTMIGGANPQKDGCMMLWGLNTNVTITNNIFYNGRNYAIDNYGFTPSGVFIDHSIVYGSPSGVISAGGVTLTNNSLNTDPMFVSLTTNDFHLQPGSPAIDSGAAVAVATDFDGNPRPLGAAFDVGAYEYNGGAGSLPAAPGALVATAVSTSAINLTWTNNSPTATAMLVENSTDNVTFTQIASLAGSATSCASAGLTAGTQYYFRVRAQNAAGMSAYSNTAGAATTGSGGSAPAAPGALTAAAVSSSAINLTWTDNSTTATAILVEGSTDNVTFTLIASMAGNATSYASTGLTAGTQYYFRVRAQNAAGTSAYSNTAGATTASGTSGGSLPAAPSNVRAGQSSISPRSQINIYWIDNSGNETGFAIFRSLDKVNFTRIATVGANVTQYDDAGLASGTKYYYYVEAWNASGTSAASNTDWTITKH